MNKKSKIFFSVKWSHVKNQFKTILFITSSFDRKTEKAFVEVMLADQKFERRDVETGISDGINVEIISGIKMDDKIKVWNKTESKKIEDNEDQGQNQEGEFEEDKEE